MEKIFDPVLTKLFPACIVCIYKHHINHKGEPVMKILISNTSPLPLYQQIVDQIREAILTGELAEGYAMPSIRVFANDLKVSVLTIRRVYEEMEREGFLISRVGTGTFVSTGNIELLRDSKRRMVEQQLHTAIKTAKSLGITRDELMDMLNILCEEESIRE